jgi:hypothetical protein
MPISVRCSCGQAMTVKDELAGKAIKCPKCGAAVRVGQPAAAAGAAKAPRPAAAQANPAAGAKRVAASPPETAALADLFEEEGIQRRAGALCPACFKELRAGAKLCTECGYNLETGERVTGVTQTRARESEFGVAELDHAVESMRSEASIQRTMKSVGFPWWMLIFIIVFVIGSGAIGVLSVDRIFKVKPKEGDPTEAAVEDTDSIQGRFNQIPVGQMWGLLLMISFVPINLISHGILCRTAFKESRKQGLLATFIPGYNYFYGLTRWGSCRSLFMAQFFSLLAALGGLALVLASR